MNQFYKTIITAYISVLFNSYLYAQDGAISTIRVPVIFHVIYSTQEENISPDSIYAELRNLHKDFLLQNDDTASINPMFKSIIGNPNIDFYVADTVFQNANEKGIRRVYSKDNVRKLYLTSPIINPNKFLNVYVGNIKIGLKSTDGFVNTNPWEFSDDDAVHLNYKWIGSRYRLLTHETGHWLGLWHIFEGECDLEGDEIADTPPQEMATDGDCEICPPLTTDKGCDVKLLSNYNNFMDYSGCRKMFTKGQVLKMRETIKNFRVEIWKSSNN